jgi:hypothetical protein
LTVPIQVKAFHTLDPDGNGVLEIAVENIDEHPGGHLAVVHLPEPFDVLYDRLFLIPFAEFRRRCPRVQVRGKAVYRFVGNFTSEARDAWSDFVIDVEHLPAWLDAIPGWTRSVPPLPVLSEASILSNRGGMTLWRGNLGRLWTAGEIGRAAGPGRVVIAEDRVRLDAVTLLVHHLASHQIAGIHLQTLTVRPEGTAHLLIVRRSFFLDDKLYLLLLFVDKKERPYEFCLLMPSTEIPKLGYNTTITLNPLTKRFAPFRVSTSDLGAVFLRKAFDS